MIFRNALIDITRPDGTPVYRNIWSQYDSLSVTSDAYSVSVHPEASTADAPFRHGALYLPTQYTRVQAADIVRLKKITGHRAIPNPSVLHVLRVQAPGNPLTAIECGILALDMAQIPAQWCQAIGPDTPGATPDADWDPVRQQVLVPDGPSFGRGWMAPDAAGALRHGYFAALPITVAENDYALLTAQQETGQVQYGQVAVLYDPAVEAITLAKGDLVVLPTNRRMVVADLFHRVQRLGVTVGVIQVLEQRAADDIVYAVPLS